MHASIDESLEKIANSLKVIASSYVTNEDDDGEDEFCECADDVLYRYGRFLESYNSMKRFEAISHMLIIGYEMQLIQTHKQFIKSDRYDEKIFDFWNTTIRNFINYIDTNYINTKDNPKDIECYMQTIANDTDMFNRMVYMFKLENSIGQYIKK